MTVEFDQLRDITNMRKHILGDMETIFVFFDFGEDSHSEKQDTDLKIVETISTE